MNVRPSTLQLDSTRVHVDVGKMTEALQHLRQLDHSLITDHPVTNWLEDASVAMKVFLSTLRTLDHALQHNIELRTQAHIDRMEAAK